MECFRLAGALDCAGTGTRENGWEGVFPSVRHPKLSQAPALQTWVAGRLCFGVLPACRSFGSRRSGNTSERLGGRVPEPASSKAVASAQAPALQTWVAGRLCFWSAPDLAELWIAPEQEPVRAARRACSRTYAIQSGRKRASASTPNLGGGAAVFLECSRLGGALDRAGTGTRRSGQL